jgi:hypothetical protein
MKLTLSKPLDAAPPSSTKIKLSAVALHKVFLHTDVLEFLDSRPASDQVAKRIRFNLQNLLAKGYAPNTKTVAGDLKGWRRALLGGTAGSHYYLWYVPASVDVGRSLGLPEGAIAVRQYRHHDDWSDLNAGDLSNDYVEITPRDIEIDSAEHTPYTPQQMRIATQTATSITTLRGYPGSGKTTSLWLTALYSNSPRILYITYSEKLANEATQFFSTFRPEGCDIEVMTYNELLDYLEDVEPTNLPPASQLARGLTEELAKKPNLLKFLVDQPDELYAELHAQALGRSLPIAFNGDDANTNVFINNYERLRRPEVGTQMAQVVSQVIEHLRNSDLVEQYFTPLVRARRNLQDIYEPPPPRLANCSMILVDEVQDLTQIEALLLFNVCARIGLDTGQMPRIVLAGDESQTVRPTDFKWGWMKNLATTVFGSETTLSDETLDVNLRSPKQIARFVEATRNQYSKFEKSDRPSGMTYTETNDTMIGRVMYCVTQNDDELEEILDIFQKIPRSCLVYPGYMPPETLTSTELGAELVTSSEEVKGLDFNVVGLVDAGSRQEDLELLLKRRADEPYVDVFGRTLADQYRVAASRASETLVLIDRQGQDHAERIRQFCSSSREEIELEFVDVADLAALLHDDVDQEELVRSFIEEIRQILDVQPERAILRSASLLKQMDRLKIRGDYDTSLENEVKRIRGVALLSGLLHDGTMSRIDASDLQKESLQLMSQIDLGGAYESVVNLAAEKSSWADKRRLECLEDALEKLEDVQRDLPEVFRRHEARFLRWHDQILQQDMPADKSKRMQILDTAHSISNYLSDAHGYLEEQVDSIRAKWAAELIGDNSFTDALQLLEGRKNRDYLGEAVCLTALKRFKDAADVFLLADQPAKAIESLRKIPDIEGALKLAEETNSDVVSTLKWLQDARFMLTTSRSLTSSELSDAEHELLLSWAKQARKKPEYDKDEN